MRDLTALGRADNVNGVTNAAVFHRSIFCQLISEFAMPSRNIEARLIQAYTSLEMVSSPDECARCASLERHGTYEVRLFEPKQPLHAEEPLFWIELFDHRTQMSLDSFGSADLEEMARAADELISDARRLSDGAPS